MSRCERKVFDGMRCQLDESHSGPCWSEAQTLPPKEALTVTVRFVGDAADAIRFFHHRGFHGPTIELVVEGLALAELRRQLVGGGR